MFSKLAESRTSSERLENELSSIKMKRDEILERMNTKRYYRKLGTLYVLFYAKEIESV